MSEALRDLGGNLPEFDYSERMAAQQAILENPHFTPDDAPLIDTFGRLGIGLQKPDWFAEPRVDDIIAAGKFTESASVQYIREYLGHFGALRVAYNTADFEADQPRATAFADALQLFKLPGEYVASIADNPQLIKRAQAAMMHHKPRNIRPDTYLAQQAQQARELRLPGNVGCRLSDRGLPELFVITELDRQQQAARAAIEAGRQAIRGSQTRESA